MNQTACKIEKNDKENTEDTITLWETGEPMREVISTDNLADAMVFLLECGFTPPGKPIDIGSGFEVSISAPADLNKAEVKFKEKILGDRSKHNGPCGKLPGNSVLQNLDRSPKTNMKSRKKSFYEWYLTNRSRLAA